MIINPEYATADEISRIFQFPSAIKIDPFAGGKVEMLHFRITKNSRLNGEQVNSIRTHINKNILIAAVDRNDHIIIPNGDFTFQENDTVSIIGKRREAVDFFKKCGLITNPIKSAMIAGGGKISYYLARNLLRAGVNVTIIEIDQKRCEELAELLPKATIICGDATDQCVLEQEGLLKTQGFAVLTGLDEENILVTLYARNNSDAKIITKINRINFTSVINELHLDCVVNPRIIMADHIIRYVRSSKKSDESNVENLYKMKEGKAIIALCGDDFAGFTYIESWGNKQYVATSGLIVHPKYRGLGLAKRIKTASFRLARLRWPKAKIFSLTSGAAVMKMNTELGYVPVTFNELTDDEAFWKGCEGCINHDILVAKNRKFCICTAMLYDPKLHEEDKI